MMNHFKKIVRLHLEEGRTLKSITAKYGVSKASISKWCKQFSEECQTNPQSQEDYDYMKENLRLRKELEEAKKENLFLKISRMPIQIGYAFFANSIVFCCLLGRKRRFTAPFV